MDQFMTAQYLATMAGQVYVVLLVTQAVRAAAPTLSTYYLRMAAMLAGVGFHAGMAWVPTWRLADYIVAAVNGVAVAFTAMKTAELIKGDAGALPAPQDGHPTPKEACMKTAIILILAGALALTGCATGGTPRPPIDRAKVAEHLLADVQCTLAIVGFAAQVKSSGAATTFGLPVNPTSDQVAAAIADGTAQQVPERLLAACSGALQNVAEDVEALRKARAGEKPAAAEAPAK
jgi:hypothetical protein